MTTPPTRSRLSVQPPSGTASAPVRPGTPARTRPESTRTADPGRLFAAVMQAPALICVTRGPNHVIELVNDLYADTVGRRPVVGVPFREAFPELPADRLTILDSVYASGDPYTANGVAETATAESESEERFFNLAVQPLRDSRGAITGLITHAVDVSDHVRTRLELAELALTLERTNRELDSFAYAASHDLRAPLRGIANLAQWIQEDLQSNGELQSDTREMLDLMRLRMHRMESLIEGLLQYSRAGRVHQNPEAVDVGVLVREVIDLLSPPANARVRVDDDLPSIRCERLLLQQVLMNLIGNALKHALRDDPEIRISARRVGQFYEFSIKDNGPGIAPEFHDRIWGIFQTLESRDRIEGAGIGLALVKKIVEGEKGRVWVESAAGDGATFRFLWRKL